MQLDIMVYAMFNFKIVCKFFMNFHIISHHPFILYVRNNCTFVQ
jgi:hypothetical protein